jgi:Hint domain-containing protein
MPFISEIHYQNSYASSSGVNEFVEVTLSPDEYARAADFDLTTYQTDGTVRETFNLGDLTPVLDPDTGYYVYTMSTNVTAPDHTTGTNEAEALALTDSTLPDPVSFYDLGGGTTNITATEGPASGATSTNISTPASGNSIQFDYYGNRLDGTLDQDSSVVCLTNGSLIDTPKGPCLIEDLCVGDLVKTLNGAQPIRMIYNKPLDLSDFTRNPRLRPVCLRKNAIAPGQPNRDLRVSPQHRMLMSGAKMQLLFGEADLLVKAKAIAAFSDQAFVDQSCKAVTYYHIVFDRHEIIFANGAATESFYPGKAALAALDPEERRELFTLFPELALGGCGYPVKSYPESYPESHATLRPWEAAVALSA